MRFNGMAKALVAVLFLFVIVTFVVRVYRTQILETREVAAKEVRDVERITHVNTIASAVAAYRDDHAGNLPGSIDTNDQYICRSELFSECSGLLDLKPLLNAYIVAFPSDPSTPTGANTFYMIRIDSDNQIIVSAPKAETKPVSATR